MDRPGILRWLVVSGILLELVCGAPLFWSLPQRDYEQPLSYQYESYQQPGPSYQETLQQVVHETLVAVRDIVLITAQVTRQEMQALAKDLYSKVHRNCDREPGEDEDQYNIDNGQGQGVAVELPEGQGVAVELPEGQGVAVENPEEHEENKTSQNGYHYNTPNKKISMYATENTAPNPQDTGRDDIENETDLNKQFFENETSTEEATKFSEPSTGILEETTSTEETTTEFVFTSTLTAS